MSTKDAGSDGSADKGPPSEPSGPLALITTTFLLQILALVGASWAVAAMLDTGQPVVVALLIMAVVLLMEILFRWSRN
jgi:hypothetical protein